MFYRDLCNALMRAKLHKATFFQRFKTLQNYDSQNEIYALKILIFTLRILELIFLCLWECALSLKHFACLSSLPCLNHGHELKASLQQFDKYISSKIWCTSPLIIMNRSALKVNPLAIIFGSLNNYLNEIQFL
jgi:hypothetical protein